MNKKAFLVVVFLMSLVWVMAYSAGAKSLQLSGKQINVSHLSSNNNNNQLIASIRDGMISTLDTWAKNHESRLQVFWATPGYPNLTPAETTYTSLLSSNNGNKLTAQMRDGLLTKLTNVMTNHEMRLRAIENKPVAPVQNEYHCIGTYQDGTYSSCVNDEDGIWQNIGWRNEYGNLCTASSNPLNKGTCWSEYNWGIYYHNKFIGYSTAEWRTEKGTKTYSCENLCGKFNEYSCPNDTYCKKITNPNIKTCSSFNKESCTKKTWCQRVKKA